MTVILFLIFKILTSPSLLPVKTLLLAHMDSLNDGIMASLDSLSRKELQQICKQLGLKANGKVFFCSLSTFLFFFNWSTSMPHVEGKIQCLQVFFTNDSSLLCFLQNSSMIEDILQAQAKQKLPTVTSNPHMAQSVAAGESEIARWLTGQGFSQYIEVFEGEDIDMDALRKMNHEALHLLKVKVGHALKLMEAIASEGLLPLVHTGSNLSFVWYD